MPLPSGPIPRFVPGKALQNGYDLNKLSDLLGSTQNGIIARAGGGKANATALNASKCRIATAATAADSVRLPSGYPGFEVSIYNAGVASVQVFGSNRDTINNVATGTGVAQAAGVTALYTCYDVVNGVGIWGRNLSA